MQDLLVDKNQFFQLLSLSDKVRLEELKIIPTNCSTFSMNYRRQQGRGINVRQEYSIEWSFTNLIKLTIIYFSCLSLV